MRRRGWVPLTTTRKLRFDEAVHSYLQKKIAVDSGNPKKTEEVSKERHQRSRKGMATIRKKAVPLPPFTWCKLNVVVFVGIKVEMCVYDTAYSSQMSGIRAKSECEGIRDAQAKNCPRRSFHLTYDLQEGCVPILPIVFTGVQVHAMRTESAVRVTSKIRAGSVASRFSRARLH